MHCDSGLGVSGSQEVFYSDKILVSVDDVKHTVGTGWLTDNIINAYTYWLQREVDVGSALFVLYFSVNQPVTGEAADALLELSMTPGARHPLTSASQNAQL